MGLSLAVLVLHCTLVIADGYRAHYDFLVARVLGFEAVLGRFAVVCQIHTSLGSKHPE